jgi:nicotinic acid mononucleotide adenylyltransferase
LSSSEIRKRFESGDVPTDLIPKRALDVARAKGLYGL